MAKVIKKTNPAALAHLNTLLQMKTASVKVGWFEDNKYPNGTPVAYVASIQEFGAVSKGITIPPRPFMRPTIEKDKGAWNNLFSRLSKQMLNGNGSMGTIMETIGLQVSGDIRRAIADLSSPALSPVTLQLRAWKKAGIKISRRSVGWAAALVDKGVATTLSGASAHPLTDTSVMVNSLTHKVENK